MSKCQFLIGKVQQQYFCCLLIYITSFFLCLQAFSPKKSVNLLFITPYKCLNLKLFYYLQIEI